MIVEDIFVVVELLFFEFLVISIWIVVVGMYLNN